MSCLPWLCSSRQRTPPSREVRLGLLFRTAGRQRGRNHNLYKKAAEIKLILHERSPQLRQAIRTKRSNRLFDGVAEELLDHRLVSLAATGEELRQIARAGKLNHFSRFGLITAVYLDRLTLLFFSESANRIEVLQCEAKRIDHRMT